MASKKWTIMVYLAGNNNLVEEMVFALREIYRIGSREDFDVIVQFDTGGPPRLFQIPPNNERVLQEGKKLEHLARTVLETPEERRKNIVRKFVAEVLEEARTREDQDLEKLGKKTRKERDLRPTSQILAEFLIDCFKKSDSESYMVILSGHGSGAVGDFLGGDTPTSRLGIRDLSAVFESVKKELGGSFNKKERIDILGMDSCLMSMAEVAFEVHEYVDFMIGAEGFERNTGWPYARLLEILMASAEPLSIEAPDLAKAIVRDYVEYYENYTLADLSTDISALNLHELRGNLVPKINALGKLMRARIEKSDSRYPNPIRDAILLSHWEAQSYKDEQYTDLWDFCDVLMTRCGADEKGEFKRDGKGTIVSGMDPELANTCLAVRDAIYRGPDAGAVILSGYCGGSFQYSHGLSVYFPWAKIKDAEGTPDLAAYSNLTFAKETYWNEFLETYVRQTQRVPRDEGRKDPSLKRSSRIDQRPGIFTSLALQIRFSPPDDRFSPPDDRFSPPDDRFGTGQVGSMKNPAVDWYPCDLITGPSGS
jgi:cysteine peptidase C11 family protein